MRNLRRALIGAIALSTLGAATALALAAGPHGPVLYRCPPCMRVANAFVRADVGPSGTWVVGTTGGDPTTPLDDDKQLLYGFMPGGTSNLGSSFTSLRIVGPGFTLDDVPATAAMQVDRGDRVETVWLSQARYRVRVTQTLRLALNPFSGQPDAVSFQYDLHNQDSVPLDLGLRSLLDVRIGDNDGAPYIIPGVGAVIHEREFVGPDVPPFWLAFESAQFDPAKLRGLGLLQSDGLTTPDRMVIAKWPLIQNTEWDYSVQPTLPVTTDSAVALYWNPQSVPPGTVRSVRSIYGLAGNRGGAAFLTTPVSAECGSSFVAALFISNFDLLPLTGGLATLALPPGLTLSPGEQASKQISTVQPGGTGSVTWSVVVAPGDQGPRDLHADAVFDGGRRFEAPANVLASCTVATATPTRTPRPSPTATTSATATRTARPTATATPVGTPPDTGQACKEILSRVPLVAINTALANPQAVYGWLEPLNPGLPVGPTNPQKTWLSMRNIAAPYHPVFNSLVFKVGCP